MSEAREKPNASPTNASRWCSSAILSWTGWSSRPPAGCSPRMAMRRRRFRSSRRRPGAPSRPSTGPRRVRPAGGSGASCVGGRRRPSRAAGRATVRHSARHRRARSPPGAVVLRRHPTGPVGADRSAAAGARRSCARRRDPDRPPAQHRRSTVARAGPHRRHARRARPAAVRPASATGQGHRMDSVRPSLFRRPRHRPRLDERGVPRRLADMLAGACAEVLDELRSSTSLPPRPARSRATPRPSRPPGAA